MNETNGFYLFVDLDDVLIKSHDDMNKDLVKKYGDQFDWGRTVDAQNHFDTHMKAMLANHGVRAQFAAKGIERIRNIVQRDGMRYDVMQSMFKEINSYEFDINYYEDENEDFHEHMNKLSKYFILKEKLLDARDTKLYQDNHEEAGKYGVFYENYYTRARLLSSDEDKHKPGVIDQLSSFGGFEGGIKVLSHYNGPNEEAAKRAFCQDCYPSTEFMPLFFHENNVYDKDFRRPRYSKAKFVIQKGYDIHRSILIDDSMENINAWISRGGIGIVYDPKHKRHDNEKYYVIHDFTFEEIMNVFNRIKADYQYKAKTLIK